MKDAKIGNMIRYVNLKELNPEEQTTVKDIINNEFEKIHRLFSGNLVNLTVHIKLHNTESKNKKYSVHIKAEAPTKIFASKGYADWDLKKAARISINEIKNNVKHNFKHQRNKKEAFDLKKQIRKTTKVRL